MCGVEDLERPRGGGAPGAESEQYVVEPAKLLRQVDRTEHESECGPAAFGTPMLPGLEQFDSEQLRR